MAKTIADKGHMGQIRLAGNPEIAVTLRRSAQARRLSLRLSQLDGRVTLTLPRGVSEAEGRAFLSDKESWLRRHLARQDRPEPVGIGTVLPIEGVPHEVCAGSGRQVTFEGAQIFVPGAEDQVSRRLQGWLKAQARDRLAEASDRYAERLGRAYSRLTLRDARSRWGSCTAQGALMYSWRLILAPPDVLDYVAAHEVSHLAEMNHSPAFWATVERIYGDWSEQRRWLHRQGATLHRYRFGD